MRKIIVLIMLISCFSGGYAQRKNELKIDTETTSVSSAQLFREKGNMNLFLRYRSVDFINARFAEAIENSHIKYKGGFELGTSYVIYPVEIEITGFYSWFDTQSGYEIDEYTLAHRGFEFSLNYFVLPYLGNISKYVYPYIGLGYQTSQLAATSWETSSSSSNETTTELDTKASLGTGGVMMKGGIRVYFTKRGFITGEYKQTLPVGSEKLFRAWSAGLGVTF